MNPACETTTRMAFTRCPFILPLGKVLQLAAFLFFLGKGLNDKLTNQCGPYGFENKPNHDNSPQYIRVHPEPALDSRLRGVGYANRDNNRETRVHIGLQPDTQANGMGKTKGASGQSRTTSILSRIGRRFHARSLFIPLFRRSPFRVGAGLAGCRSRSFECLQWILRRLFCLLLAGTVQDPRFLQTTS